MIYTRFLKLLRLKKRSAPNSKNWAEYFFFCLSPANYIVMDSLTGIVIILISQTANKKMAFITSAILVVSAIYRRQEKENIEEARPADLVFMIQAKHHQSLKEKLELDPSLALLNYRGRSLLHWCKYYSNTKAHSLILSAIKKGEY